MSDLHTLFYPKSVVVAGVSEKPDNMAAMIVRNFIHWGYRGKVYGYNPTAGGSVHGVKIYKSLDGIRGNIDLVVALSPARTLPSLVDECGARGVRFMIIESGGFSEFDESGARLGDVVTQKARRHGIRFTGPNGLGIVNAGHRMCTPFSSIEPFACGRVSVVAQSGGVGQALMVGLAEHNLTANKMISMGNKYDLDESDYLEYLIGDPGTDVILMFIESILRGRHFVELASRSEKPILMYKAGVTEEGRTRARSHTASLANDDAVVSAALAQAGVIRVRNISDLIHSAALFLQPRLKGNRLAAVSPAGGLTVVAADEGTRAGFAFPPLDKSTEAAIRERLRAGVIKISNPIDLGDAFSSDSIVMSLDKAVAQSNVDAGLLVAPRRDPASYIGAFSVLQRNVIPDVEKIIAKRKKPVVCVVYGPPAVVMDARNGSRVPVYDSLDIAFRALAAYRDFCTRDAAKVSSNRKPPLPAIAREILVRNKNEDMLAGADAFALMASLGVRVPAAEEADTPKQAVATARRIGYPVAMKIASPALSHKTDVGGVALNVNNDRTASQTAAALLDILKKHKAPGRILVQKMAEPGVELIVGARRDPSFGPVVVFGMGGVLVEVLRDTALRLAPVNRADALRMIDSIAGGALLRGVRGAKPADRNAIARAIVAVSRLIAAADNIAELDINPLIATPTGCVAVDVRVGFF